MNATEPFHEYQISTLGWPGNYLESFNLTESFLAVIKITPRKIYRTRREADFRYNGDVRINQSEGCVM